MFPDEELGAQSLKRSKETIGIKTWTLEQFLFARKEKRHRRRDWTCGHSEGGREWEKRRK